MNYEEKYNQALERARKLAADLPNGRNDRLYHVWDLENIFPELKEEEDERIRKAIVKIISDIDGGFPFEKHGIIKKKALAWLKKQGEKNPTDKVEPKFKVGDWITNGYYTWRVTDIKPLDYILQSPNGDVVDDSISYVDENLYLWTIQDAKDGDVLASNRSIFIFNQEYIAGKPEAHCGIMNDLFIEKTEGCWTNEKCYPATKEQCDLLFQKMKDAGYEWDSEKKELRKIEQQSSDKAEPTEHNYITANPEFFQWIYDRLKYVYNENPNVDYMLSLKKRIEDMQKPAWSEEDKHCIELLLPIIDSSSLIPKNRKKCKNFLKSLKPNHWKPSKEQMSMLLAVLNDPNNITSESVYIALKLLYDDLKKL